jgi:hypothetical protein
MCRVFILCVLSIACRSPHTRVTPSIEFTRLPPVGQGSPDLTDTIGGRVTGAQPGQRIVLYARSGVWWIQPMANRPFTTIQSDFTWKTSTHPGNAYAALLVDAGYDPPLTVNVLPQKAGRVAAVAVAEGPSLAPQPAATVLFSGYEWIVRRAPGNPAGSRNLYDPANAWVDKNGFLHLRIAKTPAGWSSAEVDLSRSLGYGSYRFVVRDISQMESAAVLTISTWDDSSPNREMDLEISRWGESGGKNAQYVVQPYYVPANVVRFLAPGGVLTHMFDWEPGRVSFRTVRGAATGAGAELVAAHAFTSGVPTPNTEAIRLNLFVFEDRRVGLQNGVEVIFEKFEYLP